MLQKQYLQKIISAASGNMPQADGATDVADFNHLFRSLGYADNDPNWTNPQDWLMEDGSDPGYHIMSDQEIIGTVMQERERIQTQRMKIQVHHQLSPIHKHVRHLSVHYNG